MKEILNCINEAENQAESIKEKALEMSAEIAKTAEESAEEIAKLSEAECRTYREKSIVQAEADAEQAFLKQITAKRAEASQYANDKLKDTDRVVNAIVRRVTRGGC